LEQLNASEGEESLRFGGFGRSSYGEDGVGVGRGGWKVRVDFCESLRQGESERRSGWSEWRGGGEDRNRSELTFTTPPPCLPVAPKTMIRLVVEERLDMSLFAEVREGSGSE